jgi:hypothetical protein
VNFLTANERSELPGQVQLQLLCATGPRHLRVFLFGSSRNFGIYDDNGRRPAGGPAKPDKPNPLLPDIAACATQVLLTLTF